jgi:hypothetical protein
VVRWIHEEQEPLAHGPELTRRLARCDSIGEPQDQSPGHLAQEPGAVPTSTNAQVGIGLDARCRRVFEQRETLLVAGHQGDGQHRVVDGSMTPQPVDNGYGSARK